MTETMTDNNMSTEKNTDMVKTELNDDVRCVTGMEEVIERLKKIESILEKIQATGVKSDKPRYSSVESGGSMDEGPMIFSYYKNCVKISGNTRKYKDDLKVRSCSWNRYLKSWIVGKDAGLQIMKDMIGMYGEEVVVNELE